MNKSLLLSLLLSVLLLLAGTSLFGEDLSLEDYLQKVSSDNPDIALSRQNVASASESVVQARAALLPAVGVSADYVRNLTDIMQSTAVASAGAGQPLVFQDVDTNMDNELTLAAGISQTILNPEATARYAQARRNRQIQGNVDTFTRKSILTAAKKLYAQVQLSYAIADVQADLEKTSSEVYENIQKKYEAGVVTELDLRMAEVDWKSAISATAEARKNADLAMMGLKMLGGIEPDKEITLVEDQEELPDLPGELSFIEVLNKRGDYQAQVIAREIADIAKKAALASFLPTVSTSFSYAVGGYGNGTSFSDYDFTSMQLGVTVSMPVYTGGYRTSLVRSASIEKEKRSLEILKKQDEIEQELLSLNLQMQEARKRIDSARVLKDATERAYALSRAALANGLGTQLAVSQAGTNLAQSSMNLQYALYTYRALYYDWELAVGL